MRSVVALLVSVPASWPRNQSRYPEVRFRRRATRSLRPITRAAFGTTRQTCGYTVSSSVTARRSSISLRHEGRSPVGKERFMSFKRPLFLSAAIMASAVAGCTAPSDAVPPNPVTLSSGIPGGVYHPVGNAICRMFNLDAEHEAMPCIAMSSEGSVSNIQRVESGDAAFGLSQTDVALAAFNGEGPFDAA